MCSIPALGPETYDLGLAVKEMAREVRFSDDAQWWQHPQVHGALTAAIQAYLEGTKPSDGDRKVENRKVSDLMRQQAYDPHWVGQTIARLLLRGRSERFEIFRRRLAGEAAKKKGKTE